MKIALLILLVSNISFGKDYLDESLKTMNWNGVDVVWLEDNALPNYDVSFYFAEGALGDGKKYYGETEMMFAMLSSGTKRFTQNQIVESLEFYGAEFGTRVTHEYSTFSVSGLMKDFRPTMKMICHLYNDATFPKKEVKKLKSRVKTGFKNLVSNHRKLAARAFRYESLVGTGFEHPTTGTMASTKRIDQRRLLARLKHFNENVYKRIYIRGPAGIKVLEKIVSTDCGWKKAESKIEIPKVTKNPAVENQIIFVPVPNANQAQVQVGRVLLTSDIEKNDQDIKTFAANFLGGGFTSQLIQVLRVQKGLTYSAGAYSSDQKMYGRSGISTFTKNETIVELLDSMKEVLKKSSTDMDAKAFQLSKNNMKGNYLLGLESTAEFLKTLLHFDHIGKKYEEIYNFPRNVEKTTVETLQKVIDDVYGWKSQTVLILGNKKLVPKLKKAGYKVKVRNYKDYL